VLRVIASSPGELEPVFRAMLEYAVRICEAKFGTLYLCEGDRFRAVAMHNAPPAYAQAREAAVRPPPESSLGQAAKTKQARRLPTSPSCRATSGAIRLWFPPSSAAVTAPFSAFPCSRKMS